MSGVGLTLALDAESVRDYVTDVMDDERGAELDGDRIADAIATVTMASAHRRLMDQLYNAWDDVLAAVARELDQDGE